MTFEGPEGAGKTTQIRRLAGALAERGYDVLATREPGGTAIGEAIRAILLSPDYAAMLPTTEALLNTAARAQHVAEVIAPARRAGKIVLCDRYVDSTLAYQGAGRGLDLDKLTRLQDWAIGGLRPDLTILLDLPVETGWARRRSSGQPLNRLDRDTFAFHQRVREGFLRAARNEPDRWRVIAADALESAVAGAVLNAVLARLGACDGE